MYSSKEMDDAVLCNRVFDYLRVAILIAISLYSILRLTDVFLNSPTHDFPVQTDIEISEGISHKQIAEKLKNDNVVRSSLYFYFKLKNTYPEAFIKAGTYNFDNELSTIDVLGHIVNGTAQSSSTKVTLSEGFRTRDLYTIMPSLTEDIALEQLELNEGYLFPDTYFIPKAISYEKFIDILKENFKKKLNVYSDEIMASGLSLDEVIILASIIEREAKDLESKKIVSGILQSRLEIGMPLQVDAVFNYILDKRSDELTQDDLFLDSPYNTYRQKGLPPTPISNPGIDSIEAVFHPIETENLYYLTASDGTFYYAVTFDEHKENKNNFLQ